MLRVSYNLSNLDKSNFFINYFCVVFTFIVIFVFCTLVLAIYGFKYLGYDSKMSVLCFMHISNDSIVDDCFNCCEGILSTKLALYIYALRYTLRFLSNTNFLELPTDQVCSISFVIIFEIKLSSKCIIIVFSSLNKLCLTWMHNLQNLIIK